MDKVVLSNRERRAAEGVIADLLLDAIKHRNVGMLKSAIAEAEECADHFGSILNVGAKFRAPCSAALDPKTLKTLVEAIC